MDVIQQMNAHSCASAGPAPTPDPASARASNWGGGMSESSASLQGEYIDLARFLKSVLNSLVRTTNDILKSQEVTLSLCHPLRVLVDEGALTVSVLAARLDMNNSSLCRLLDRLEDRGLCARTRSKIDRRVVTVEISTDGRRIVRGLSGALHQADKAHLAGMTSQEQASLRAMLSKMMENGTRMAHSSVAGGESPSDDND